MRRLALSALVALIGCATARSTPPADGTQPYLVVFGLDHGGHEIAAEEVGWAAFGTPHRCSDALAEDEAAGVGTLHLRLAPDGSVSAAEADAGSERVLREPVVACLAPDLRALQLGALGGSGPVAHLGLRIVRAEDPAGAAAEAARSVPLSERIQSGVNTAISGRLSQVRSCYEGELYADPALAGSLFMVLQSSPGGRVHSLGVSHVDGLSFDLEACMVRRLRGVVLPASERGLLIRYPFRFATATGTGTGTGGPGFVLEVSPLFLKVGGEQGVWDEPGGVGPGECLTGREVTRRGTYTILSFQFSATADGEVLSAAPTHRGSVDEDFVDCVRDRLEATMLAPRDDAAAGYVGYLLASEGAGGLRTAEAAALRPDRAVVAAADRFERCGLAPLPAEAPLPERRLHIKYVALGGSGFSTGGVVEASGVGPQAIECAFAELAEVPMSPSPGPPVMADQIFAVP